MSSNTHLVYIVLPCYNAEKYLLEQLMSIYYQNYSNWYLIFINDWSTDNSEAIARDRISHYNLHDKVKIINKENWWLNSSIQRWLEEVKKLCDIHNTDSLVAYCDADDMWTKNKLELQINFMLKHPEYWLTYHNSYSIDQNNEIISPRYQNHFYREENFFYMATIWNRYNWPTMLFKPKYIDYIIPMPQWKHMAQDLWTALALWLNNIKILFLDNCLLCRRVYWWSMQRNLEKKSTIEQNKIRMEYYYTLQKRFPDKDISDVIKYNYDRYIVWQQKKYWRIRIILCMLFKYPKIFFKWLKAFLLTSLHIIK